MSATDGPATVVTAATFVVDFIGTPMRRMSFSELGGITTKVTPQEYIYSDEQGRLVHTKQFGKTEPPTVVLKRGVDLAGTNAILLWHQMARDADPMARADGTLTVYDAHHKETASYLLHEAWLSEVNIASVKAGTSEVALLECKITCSRIQGAQR